MENTTSDAGPYRATKLWNDVIRDFRTNMPLKKHRRHIRMYDNCFTAIEATNWLNERLNENPEFGGRITRQQTFELLRKFYKSKVFEDIKGSKTIKSADFKENCELYRLTQNSPLRVLRTPGRKPLITCENNPKPSCSRDLTTEMDGGKDEKNDIPDCHVVTRQLTVQEMENVWKGVTLNRLQTVLGLPDLDVLIDVSNVNPKHIIHNVTRVGKSGIVAVLDKNDDLPHWVLSAMKCLANWPNASGTGSCLPKYPGFEGDVFKVVKDYFCNLGVPLSTYAMYDVFIAVMVRAEYLDIGPRSPFSSSYSQLSSFSSVENFLNRAGNSVNNDRIHPSVHSDNSSTALSESRSATLGRTHRSEVNDVATSSSLCFETAFTTASPVTRIVKQREKLARNEAWRKSYHGIDIESMSNHLPRSQSVADASIPLQASRSARFRSCTDIRSPAVRQVDQKSVGCYPESVVCYPDHNYHRLCNDVNVRRLRTKCGGYYNLAYLSSELETDVSSTSSYHTATNASPKPRVVSPNLETSSSTTTTMNVNRESHRRLDDDMSHVSSSYISAESELPDPMNFAYCEESRVDESPKMKRNDSSFLQNLRRCESSPNFFSGRGKQCAVEVLQLVSLLLPPSHRRQLHFLLRFMSKVSLNLKLLLSAKVTNRALVLHTFLRCIMNAKSEDDYDEIQAIRLVMFLMDHHEEILRVPPCIQTQVEEQLALLHREKIQYAVDDPSSITYCEQVSKVEYERQRLSHSERALMSLLDGILLDKRLSQRERKKRLKQFKETYPKIYKERFPLADESEITSTSTKGSSIPALIQKFKNMRV